MVGILGFLVELLLMLKHEGLPVLIVLYKLGYNFRKIDISVYAAGHVFAKILCLHSFYKEVQFKMREGWILCQWAITSRHARPGSDVSRPANCPH